MSPVQEHPSFLALDRPASGPLPAALRAHVESCEACAAHLARVQEHESVPGWARALEDPAAAPRWPLWRGLVLVASLASLALMVWRVVPAVEAESPYVGVKGGPALALYVKRAEQVQTWDGTYPVRPGDSLRLQVAAQGYGHVWVGTLADGRPVTLYRGALPAGGELLPPSWRVNAQGHVEQLLVVLSREPLSGPALAQALDAESRGADVWVEQLLLRKELAP
jgi:hypothetical protein